MNPANSKFFVATDVDHIKAYLLGSTKLREVAGASQLLEGLDKDPDGILRKCAADAGTDALVVFAAGGAGLFGFQLEATAAKFVSTVRHEATKHLGEDKLVVSGIVAADPNGAERAREAAVEELQRFRRARQVDVGSQHFPTAMRCDGCGLEVVTVKTPTGIVTAERVLGPLCEKKGSGRTRVVFAPPEASAGNSATIDWNEDVRRAKDFDEIAGDDPLGLAVVVADVDGAGRKLAATPLDKVSEFSKLLQAAIQASAVSAVETVVKQLIDKLSSEDPPKHLAKFPAETIYCAGDDLVIVTRGSIGLPFVHELTKEFVAKHSKPGSPLEGLTISSGIAIVGPHFPFRIAYDFATRLLREAKATRKRLEWNVGAADYAIVSESGVEASVVLGDRQKVHGRNAIRLTGRPFKAEGTGPRSLGAFRDACRELGASFPASKLHETREWGSVARIEAEAGLAIPFSALLPTLDRTYAAWRARLRRFAAAESQWVAALKALGDPSAPTEPSSSAVPWTDEVPSAKWTAIPDLCDGQRLWGV